MIQSPPLRSVPARRRGSHSISTPVAQAIWGRLARPIANSELPLPARSVPFSCGVRFKAAAGVSSKLRRYKAERLNELSDGAISFPGNGDEPETNDSLYLLVILSVLLLRLVSC